MIQSFNVKSLRFLFSLIAIMLVVFSCVNPPDYPNEPVINYEGVNKTAVYQGVNGLPADTLEVFISFTDGDGDLSFQDSSDIFLYDSRFPSDASQYRIPLIPIDGTGNGIRGELTIRTLSKAQGICCIQSGTACPDVSLVTNPIDTFTYEIQIRDRSGNFSNKVRTEIISILCKL